MASANRQIPDLCAWATLDGDAVAAFARAANIWRWQVDRAGTFTYCGPEVEELLGYEPDELLGKNLFDLILPADAIRARAQFESFAAANGSIHETETIKFKRSGAPLRTQSLVMPLISGNTCVGYIGADRRVFGSLQDREAMWELERGVAHSLNNFFAIILGDSELLLDGIDESQKQLVRAIEEAVKAATLLNAHRQNMERVRRCADLQDFAVTMAHANELLPCILGKKIDLNIETAPAAEMLRCDPSRIYRLLFSVAVTLRQVSEQPGKLTIRVSPKRFCEPDFRPPGVLVETYILFALTFTRIGENGTPPFQLDSIQHADLESFVRPYGGYVYPTAATADTVQVLMPAFPAKEK